MAQRRMFSKKITETDLFLDMPMSAQCLYFHLNMSADDDGFIGNAKTIRRMIGASEDDLKLLLAKEFLIPFDNGVVVIKDWKIHNYIQRDRYNETIYKDEKSSLVENENKQYQRLSHMDTQCIQNVSNRDTQVRLGKDRLGKDNTLSRNSTVYPYEEIIKYLNDKANKQYKHTTKKTQTLIKSRFNEGFNLEDFKSVIDTKSKEWMNTDMEKYLRPETLFGTKFESYLNQKELENNDEISGLPTGSYDPLADVRDLEI